ncbi:soluble lytic murein transglycosylase [Leptolinea tardivitalis]|nr:soluble lytic murein transglycosylase [Leptolinea tardivitalis]
MFDMSSSSTSNVQMVMIQALIKLLEKTLAGKGLSGDLSELSGSSTSKKAGSFESIIQKASAKYGVDADLVKAVIQNESAYDPEAVSSAGAMGLMQLMPATAASLGVENPLDPEENIEGGVKLLRELLNQFGGNLTNTVAAYNAGAGAVQQYGGVPPYQETQLYVNRVLSTYGKS